MATSVTSKFIGRRNIRQRWHSIRLPDTNTNGVEIEHERDTDRFDCNHGCTLIDTDGDGESTEANEGNEER